MRIYEAECTDTVTGELIRLSGEWEAEGSCRGYRANTPEDLTGRRIFLAEENDRIFGYLFGIRKEAERSSTVMEKGTPFFEVEELYVVPEWRSRGIGRKLFEFAETQVQDEAEVILLSTATKNWRAVLHFYLEELDLEFWSATLFKHLTGASLHEK
jgi:GNAT superfamily N-acetyltransferase